MQKTTFLQSRSLSAGTTQNFDAPPHPSKGLLIGYLFRVNCTLNAASNVTPTYIEWRDTILDTLFPSIQLFAPRYNNQLCSGNLTGRFWAELYEDKYKRSIPIEYNDLPIDQNNTQQLTNANVAAQVDIPVFFDEPELGTDRFHFCPPAHLFRGDVTASFGSPAALTVTVQSVVITMASATVRWLALTTHGDIARVPVKHRFEVRSVNSDSVDVGRGFPMYVADRRTPGTTVSYDLIVDGENVNGGQVNGEDLMAAYRSLNAGVAPETSVRTPLLYVGEKSNYNQVDFIERSFSLKLYGASSATLLLHFADPADDMLKKNVAAALGLPAEQTVAVPVTPTTAALGSVHRKLAQNGPRTLLAATAGGLRAPEGSAKTVPTVPAGTQGAAMAGAISGR
jgi:hypothetical protein